jgi:hypothetical protein
MMGGAIPPLFFGDHAMQKIVIENTKTHVWGMETFFLYPGQNIVLASEWEQAQKCDDVLEMLERGDLVVTSEKGDAIESGKLDLTPAKAIKMVSTTYDLALLVRWLATEKRPAVSKAIAEQIGKIRTTEKPKADNADNGNNLEFL